ncbi:MAG: primosomal protein N' [Acutalibacteraceae bacterium]|nr:primosomal protein N' [Acutalibacteraceae bacterium]
MSGYIIASVAIENSTNSFDMAYDYLVNEKDSALKPGCRVLVPFGKGNKCRQGIVMSVFHSDKSTDKLKSIMQVIDEKTILSDEMIKLIEWLKERTFCTLFDAAKTILPAGMCHRVVTTYAAAGDVDLSGVDADALQIYEFIKAANGYVDGEKVLKTLGFVQDLSVLERMTKDGLLFRNYDSARKAGDLTVKMVRITETGLNALESTDKITKKQREILELLADIDTASVKEVCYFTGFTPAVVHALAKKGYAEIFDNEVYRIPGGEIQDVFEAPEIVLNDEQKKAYNSLLKLYNKGEGGASLLFGVTGSGKTQVYLKLIDYMVSVGKQVIVMVPEIALTPQTIQIFRRRYGGKTAVIHSALSAGQRMDEWKRIKNGEVQIVVGTRSAVFAPFDNLGLIIVDEEQEHTYKSEKSPRYSAKEVALFRSAYHKAVTVFASATPSLETYSKAKSGRYTINKLSKRYSTAELPDVRIVDMCIDALSDSSYFSKELADSISDNLEKGHQTILLMNRRGYNTFASCKSCGYVFTCPSCSISMTYHRANGRLMCHYCGHSQPFSSLCPECNSTDVRYSGVGTQKIEDELTALFPSARILRMDADSTMSRHAHEEKLSAFAKGEYDILLGTQMVAKGLDFENVTLVGVINADGQLNNDDFRSQERTFDLITQVVGRAGRGKFKGKAIIQTMTPENDVINMAANQDYESFYKTEMKLRKMLIYPPFCDIALIGFLGIREENVHAAASKFFLKITEKIRKEYKDEKVIILGPMTARVSKVSNKYRYRLIIKCKNSKNFRKMMSEVLTEVLSEVSNRVSVYIDINPENII